MTQRSYHQYCAMARALDAVGDRWSLLIVRNLILGPQRFSDLKRDLPGIASNLLSGRLGALTDRGILEPRAGLYALTPVGQQLETVLFGLAAWGEQHFMGSPAPKEALRVRYAMTSMRRKIRPVGGPARVLVTIEDEDYTCVCGPQPQVVQGGWPGHDLHVQMDVAAMRALLFAGEPLLDWVRRPQVAIHGALSVLEQLQASLTQEPNHAR